MWDQHLPEFRFALNSAVQEISGVTPAELHLGRPLKGPMDGVLQSSHVSSDCPAFDSVHHHHTLLAKQRQLINYDIGETCVSHPSLMSGLFSSVEGVQAVYCKASYEMERSFLCGAEVGPGELLGLFGTKRGKMSGRCMLLT